MFRLKCFMLNRHNIVLSKTNMGFFVRVYPKQSMCNIDWAVVCLKTNTAF